MNSNSIIISGSIGEIAKRDNVPLAVAFLDVEVVVLVDTSGSMDARDGKAETRYTLACGELARLQNQMPGKIMVVTFSDHAEVCPSGVPKPLYGSTNLRGALEFTKTYDISDMRFIVISDGAPDDEQGALAIAARYTGQIDTIYIGPEGGSGAEFLRRLAAARGGQSQKVGAAQIAATATRLLLGA